MGQAGMIRKSVKRFSEEIMPKQQRARKKEQGG
jgi:hypothetical protein